MDGWCLLGGVRCAPSATFSPSAPALPLDRCERGGIGDGAAGFFACPLPAAVVLLVCLSGVKFEVLPDMVGGDFRRPRDITGVIDSVGYVRAV